MTRTATSFDHLLTSFNYRYLLSGGLARVDGEKERLRLPFQISQFFLVETQTCGG
jgi:hypothetical protein